MQVSLTPERIAGKQAFREIIRGCGGLEAAELHCRVGKSQLARYYDPTTEEYAPQDVIADLEPLARNRPGWPHATRQAASDLGFTLLDQPQVEAPDCPRLHAALRASVDKSGKLQCGMLEALGDGEVTGDEARSLLSVAMEAAEEALRIHALLKLIAEEC